MKIENMLGYKLYKEENDKLISYRIIKIRKPKSTGAPCEITVKDLDTDEILKVKVEDLKGFTPLRADGYLTFNIVHINDQHGGILRDVVVTASKIDNLEIGDNRPYAVCRQSITDVFYNLLCKDYDDMIVGLSVSQDTCPTNFDFFTMLACDGIDYSDNVYYYRDDTIENIYPMIKIYKFNDVLYNNFMKHVKHIADTRAAFKKQDKGWCKDLQTLLKENNFQMDVDQMLKITALDFDLKESFISKQLPGSNDEYTSLVPDLITWINQEFRLNINNITVIKYDIDINLVDFKDSKYLLFRDNQKDLYLLVYTENTEALEADLSATKEDRIDFSDKYRIQFINKYFKKEK
jgi:hypothetical protein